MIQIKTHMTLWGGEKPRSPCCAQPFLGDEDQFKCPECGTSYALYAEQIDTDPANENE